MPVEQGCSRFLCFSDLPFTLLQEWSALDVTALTIMVLATRVLAFALNFFKESVDYALRFR